MAWQDECVTILRVILSDLDPAKPQYSDDSLLQVLVVAGQMVLVEMRFSQNFVTDVVNVVITPDPTDTKNNTRDNAFVNLLTMKSACIISHGEARLASNQGLVIRDGSSSVDLRPKLGAKLELLQKGWCFVYDDAKLQYLAGQVRTAGAAVMTPFRVVAGYNEYGYGMGTATAPWADRSAVFPYNF